MIPPILQYIHKLVYNDLNRHTAKNVLKQLRKMPWDSESEVSYSLFSLLFALPLHHTILTSPSSQAQILDTFTKIHRGKYGNIHVVASLVAALSQYHGTLGVKLVDILLRNITNGLEVRTRQPVTGWPLALTDLFCGPPQHPEFKYQQRRVVEVKYLGELYNYRLIESGTIFYVFYLLLTHCAGLFLALALSTCRPQTLNF